MCCSKTEALIVLVVRLHKEGKKRTFTDPILRRWPQELLLVFLHALTHLAPKSDPEGEVTATFHGAEVWPPCVPFPSNASRAHLPPPILTTLPPKRERERERKSPSTYWPYCHISRHYLPFNENSNEADTFLQSPVSKAKPLNNPRI